MSEENYYAKDAISNSDLGYLKISPRQFVMRKEREMQTKTAAMELGTLIHKFTLEPDEFIIADVEPQVLAALAMNKMKGNIKVCIVDAPT